MAMTCLTRGAQSRQKASAPVPVCHGKRGWVSQELCAEAHSTGSRPHYPHIHQATANIMESPFSHSFLQRGIHQARDLISL